MALILKTIIQLPATPAATLSATLEIVSDPTGSPVSEKMTVQQLVDLLSTVFGATQIYQGRDPAAPDDPTQACLSYPSGGGTLTQWDVGTQTWV